MKHGILLMVNKLEGWKTAIKNLHWSAINLSQHRLCDDIASEIADIQDTISEVEQSMSGKLPLNMLKPVRYRITNLKTFLKSVIKETTAFYNSPVMSGEHYIGMRSDIEQFLSNMQKFIYLNNFCLKEDYERREKLVEMTTNAIHEMVMESIDIDPANKGKFNATMERTGETAEELKHSKNPLTRKRATFALNARKWHHK